MSSRRVRTTEKWGGKAGGMFPKEYARISYTIPPPFQMLSTLNRSWEFNCNINKDTWFGFSLDLFCLCSTLETLTLQREQKMRQTQTNTKSQSFFFFLKHEQILTYATSTLYGKCVDRRSKIICQKSEFECVPHKM